MKLDDIAKLAGVSKTTVSYVINGKSQDYRISRKTHNKVMDVISRYNFKSNKIASNLRRGKTNILGLILPEICKGLYIDLIREIEEQSRTLGYKLILCCTEYNNDMETQMVSDLLGCQVDILLVITILNEHEKYYSIQNNSQCNLLVFNYSSHQMFLEAIANRNYDINMLIGN